MHGKRKGEQYLQCESVKNWFESLSQIAVSKGKTLTARATGNRLRVLDEYVTFSKKNPDELLEEGKADIKNAMARLTGYFNWLLGKEVEGMPTREKKMSWNSACTTQAYMRGFYTHLGLHFPKRFAVPTRKVSAVSRQDTKTPIYDYDADNDEIVFRNGLLQHFLGNLNFRDQTIGLCLLSTGADASDLLALDIDFVKDDKGNLSKAKRFLWHSNRLKDGIEFKTFFSEEATEFLKRYVEQERANANDDEPLFVKEDGGRLPTHALAMNFRTGAKKMGITKAEKANPFRPKRFRHLFRTAFGTKNIDQGYTNAMMGHATDVSAGYLNKSNGLFLKAYVQVEPLLTVYGVQKTQLQKVNEELDDMKVQLLQLQGVVEAYESKTKITREDLMKEWLRDHADEGLGGGISRKPDFGYDDLTEAEKDKYFHRALRRKMFKE